MLNQWTIEAPAYELETALRAACDAKTKPLGSLGRLEELAIRLGLIQRTLSPDVQHPALLVFAGDHGLAKRGVSPYPQSVTTAMVRNFAHGGAAINVLSRELGWHLTLVNSGTLEDTSFPGVIDRSLGKGTRDILEGPAMDSSTYEQALQMGADLVRSCKAQGAQVIAAGEMGIGNSSAAALIAHALTDLPLERLVSRGAGCDDHQLKAKQAILASVREKHGPLGNPDAVLQHFAGFEMVMAGGAMLEAARLRLPFLVDGLIISSVALAVVKAQPQVLPYLIFAHRSSALGHDAILEHLGVKPLLDLDMRLGEGTGAALALPLLKCAVALLRDMATFDSADVARAEARLSLL
jgi:nicotinate-nucleotide--dimethylbenzimidazole phosphoribosyltransferase